MKKGSRSRKCHICGEIVAWSIPTGENILGFPIANMIFLPNYGGNDRKGYVCKKCWEAK